MIKELEFARTADGGSEATFVSQGGATVQIQRTAMKGVTVLGNIPGMPPCVVGTYGNPFNKGILIAVDLPVGVTVTIRCACEVESAKMMTDD